MSERRPPRSLPAGLYERPVTADLAEQLHAIASELQKTHPLHADSAPAALARLVHDRLLHSLQGFKGKAAERLEQQVALANALVEVLTARGPRGTTLPGDQVDPPARALLAILPPAEGLGTPTAPVRPEIPLSTSDLLTNARHDLSLGAELRRELASADRVDLLCSFLKWRGLHLVQEDLRALLRRRPGAVRVITTAYMGVTELRALEELVEVGATVKVSYDTSRTRLHAKAWLLHRATGYSTGFVGSSNLSAAAMLDGLEWNVRLSAVDNGAILDKFAATFEQYWADPEFEAFDPARDADRYANAVRRQRSDRNRLITALEVEARPHQKEILDALESERARGHSRNLVVAATGTGKTILAALDYKRLRRAWRTEGADDSLLFVAHRKEILEQSLDTFRVVLRDPVFGERLFDGEEPRAHKHVFASIQSLTEDRLARLDPQAYRMVIVDEFHHAAADSYERVLRRLQPTALLGLTATPERADGRSVLGWFDERVAAELRLWKALDQNLLCPFHYFGVAGPDVSSVTWRRGQYDAAELRAAYDADPLFTKRILQEVHRHVVDPETMRALAFCVDIEQAVHMAERFDEAGLAAKAVSGRTPGGERDAALAALREGSLRVLFSVDLFNEGLDVPDVDTVIFLRPTESATLFLQQLGRGLRLSEGKTCLTVLDFIGNAHRRFRFDARFRALLGGTRRAILDQVQRGFPNVPPGCSIQLDPAPQAAVVANIRAALSARGAALVDDLKEVARECGQGVQLEPFLARTQLDVEDVYSKPGRTWTTLRRAAQLAPTPAASPPGEDRLLNALPRMLHLDDDLRLAGFRDLLERDAPPAPDPRDPTQRLLFVLLGHMRRPYAELAPAWEDLWRNEDVRDELHQLLRVLDDRRRTPTHALDGPLRGLPLRVHATYSLDEVMAAVDERNRKGGVKRIQTGTHRLASHHADLLFVTLEKSPDDYSPTTLYNDYPLSPTRFHWETQSNCHADTPTGRRYLGATPGARDHVLLFVRRRRTDARGCTMPYVNLGPCHPAAHRGARPMQIEWELEHAMPPALFQEVKVAAG
ncbi:MAG: DUF3427 domain-containing protein [Planctomycetes bacterium]|nr:DUF3427 domain-containing protein [Planctomycetota bacterium]